MKLTASSDFLRARLLGSSADRYQPPLWRAIPDAIDPAGSNGRIVRYKLSDSSVARDGHTIATKGWDFANYLKNPVVLWAHSSNDLPIGRMVELGAIGDRVMGSVEYADADTYPFADTVYRLVKGGYLNAVSVSWLPLDWKFAEDRSRPGGIDFTRVELLEVSQVPVPALPSALVDARAAGIDTGPIYEWAERVLDGGENIVIPRAELEQLRRAAKMPTPHNRADGADWKVGAARDLPLGGDRAWDGPAAAGRMLDAATSGEDGDKKIDAGKAKRGFLLYDAANPDLRGSYKEPFADLTDGKLEAIPAGIRAAASRLPQTKDIPAGVKDSARGVIDHYESKMKDEGGSRSGPIAALVRQIDSATAETAKKRGLGMAGWLLMLLDELYDFVNAAKLEATQEGDDSPAPAALLACANDLAAVAMAYAAEEIAEEAEGEDVEIGYSPYMMAAPEAERRASCAGMLRALDRDAAPTVPAAAQDALVLRIGPDVAKSVVDALARDLLAAEHMRSGRVLSSDNESRLRNAYDLLGSVLAMVAAPEPQEVDEVDAQRAVPPIREVGDVDTERAAAQAFLATVKPAKAA